MKDMKIPNYRLEISTKPAIFCIKPDEFLNMKTRGILVCTLRGLQITQARRSILFVSIDEIIYVVFFIWITLFPKLSF